MHLGVLLLSVALISAGQTLGQTTGMEAPPETTEVPATTADEPSESTEVPATTDVPRETTDEPVETTNGPAKTTEVPLETTNEPVETTNEPATTTEEPSETTNEPAKTTEVPLETTNEPVETTNEPATTTEEPPETTNEPATTTEEPPETMNEPATTTEVPSESTEVPATTEEPSETTDDPLESTEVPATTDVPRETTDEPPETTEEPATTTAVPSTTTVGPSIECANIKNGIVMHPFDCQKYIVCHDGMATILACPLGQIFSWKTLSCDTSNICTEYSTGFETLESVACRRQTAAYAEHPFLPYQYVDCANLATRSCARNTIFRWKYQRCLPGSQATNQLQPVKGRCGFWGQKRHPYLCEQYYQCRFWVVKKKTCGTGLIYDASRKKCRSGNFQTCQFSS
uniref:Chitin-binding type-2 domain-containing protein n=1 Tax=Anopheles atroparvus TaxID=41427 RepID=A0AAG5DGR5_ANOAO